MPAAASNPTTTKTMITTFPQPPPFGVDGEVAAPRLAGDVCKGGAPGAVETGTEGVAAESAAGGVTGVEGPGASDGFPHF